MPSIKNPNYDPNDPSSKRFVRQEDVIDSSYQDAFTISGVNVTQKSENTPVKPSTFSLNLGNQPSGVAQSTPSSLIKPVQQLAQPPVTNPILPKQGSGVITQPVTPQAPQKTIFRDGANIHDGATGRLLGRDEFLSDYDGQATEIAKPLQRQQELGGISDRDQQTVDRLAGQASVGGGQKPVFSPIKREDPALTGELVTDNAGLGDLVRRAGEAGLSLEDTMALVNAQTGVTQAEKDQIRNNLGIPDLIDERFADPSKTTQEIYTQAYRQSGLGKIKGDISKIDDQINTIREQVSKATTDERKNPFISQATRTGRLRIMNQDAEQKIANLNNQKTQLLGVYDNGINEIEGVVSRFKGQLETDKTLTVEKLNFLLSEAERQEEGLTGERQADSLRFVPDFLEAKTSQPIDPFSKAGLEIKLQELKVQELQQKINKESGTGAGALTPQEQVELETAQEKLRVLRGDKTVGEKEIAVDIANTLFKNITRLLNDTEGLSDAVGTISSKLPTLEGSTADFERAFEQIQDLFALGNTDKIKGAMSDKDIELLRNASAGISLNMSEKGFKKKLVELQTGISDAIARQMSADYGVADSDIKELFEKGDIVDVRNFLEQRSQKKNDEVSVSGTGMRTDRHNNPTAFTTDIAKQGGLVEGVDYEVGDAFPNNPNQTTARLIGDPVAQTIKVIDKIGFYTRSGNQRWTHTAIDKNDWNNLSPEQKKQVVQDMYGKEGNKGQLNNFFA